MPGKIGKVTAPSCWQNLRSQGPTTPQLRPEARELSRKSEATVGIIAVDVFKLLRHDLQALQGRVSTPHPPAQTHTPTSALETAQAWFFVQAIDSRP